MTTAPTILPPGPYRYEPGDTADTYRIFAAGDDMPMVEMIYIGGAEDFAAVAQVLARLFTSSSTLMAVLNTLREDCRMALSGEWDRSDSGFEAMSHLIDVAIDEATTGEQASQMAPDQHAARLMAALRAILPYAEAELASLQAAQKRDGGLEAEVAACDGAIEQASQLLSQIEAGAS